MRAPASGWHVGRYHRQGWQQLEVHLRTLLVLEPEAKDAKKRHTGYWQRTSGRAVSRTETPAGRVMASRGACGQAGQTRKAVLQSRGVYGSDPGQNQNRA